MGQAGGDDSSFLTNDCCSVFNLNRGLTVATQVYSAGTSRTRRRGLLGLDSLAGEAGIWIAPSEAIHTFGMKMPIDVVFLDRELRVRKLRPKLGPARIAVCLRAYSVLELASGTIARSGMQVGDQLRITGSGARDR